MNINDFTIQMFNNHKAVINILITEPLNQNIYADKEKKYISARTNDYNFKILTVREMIKVENELYFKIEYKGKKVGLFKPDNSVILIPKYKSQIKITKSAEFNNNLNKYLEVSEKHFEENRARIAFSKYYAIFQGEIFETVVLAGELLVFLKSVEINNLFKVEKNFSIKNDVMTYKNNELTKKWKPIKATSKIYTSRYVLPQEKKIKFKYGGRDAWIDENFIDIDIDIDYDIKDIEISDVNYLLFETMLKNYSEKIEDYHIYYSKILKNEMKKQGEN